MSQSASSSPSEDPNNHSVLPTAEQFHEGDLNLDVLLQSFVSTVTGLPGNLVRPRWQPVEPTYPEIGTNWCACGVTLQEGDVNTMTTVGADEQLSVHRHETITFLSSFYGPNASEYASRFRDGVAVGQNRWFLDSNGMGVQSIGSISRVPTLLNQQWQNRVDFTLLLRRHTIRTYPLTTVTESTGSVTDGSMSQPFDTGVTT